MKLTKNIISIFILFLLVNSSVISFKHEVSVHHKRSHARVKHTYTKKNRNHSTRKTSRNFSHSHFNANQMPADEVSVCDQEVDKSKFDLGALFAAFALKLTSTSFFNDVISFVTEDIMKMDKLEDVCVNALVDLFDKKLEESKAQMREIYNSKVNDLSEKIDHIEYMSKEQREELKKIKNPRLLCKKINEHFDSQKRDLQWIADHKKANELLRKAKETAMTYEQMKKSWGRGFFSEYTVEGRAKFKSLMYYEINLERNKNIADEKERHAKAMDDALSHNTNWIKHLENTSSKKDTDLANIAYCDKLPDEFNPCADLTSIRIGKAIINTLGSLKGSACSTLIVAYEFVAFPQIAGLIAPAMENFAKTILTSWFLPVKLFWYLIRVSICGFKALKTKDKFMRSWYLGNGAAYLVKMIVTSLTAGALYKKKKLRRYKK